MPTSSLLPSSFSSHLLPLDDRVTLCETAATLGAAAGFFYLFCGEAGLISGLGFRLIYYIGSGSCPFALLDYLR